MDEHSQNSLPTLAQKTMDPKFIVVLFCVEAGALVFNSMHVQAPEIHLYNAYNQIPLTHNISSQLYFCFAVVNQCIYEHEHLRFLKVIHLSFIVIIVLCYLCLFALIHRRWENTTIRRHLGITWYGAIQLLVLLSMLEVAYIGFDILNRQASIHALHQNFEYRARAAEYLTSPPSSEDFNLVHFVQQQQQRRRRGSPAAADSFETVNQDFLSELIEI